MSDALVAGLLVAGVVVLTPLSDRLRVPSPVLLTIFGLVLALVPRVPQVAIEPDLILPIVLPPLLFAATQRATAREFRDNARPILLLAVGLTLASAALAAWIAHLAGLGWGAAWVLGAVVAPPDPVAASAVARRLRLPDRVVTVLEGEGMFNDAAALVLYGLAVATVVSGRVGPGEATLRLVLSVSVGIAVGLALGWLTRLALKALHDDTAETTVTVAMPFAAYLVAEELWGSGVLAVLALGLFLRSYGTPAITSGGWLLGRAVWRFADYLITSLVFVLIGFELTDVLQANGFDGATVWLGVAVVGALIVGRIVWMFPAVTLARLPQIPDAIRPTYGTRETVVVAWAGMRGVVTIATALALPLVTDAGTPFPDRERIVFVGLFCVLVTLVLQGLTLGPLVTWLGVGGEGGAAREIVLLRRRAIEAALASARSLPDDVPAPVRSAVVLQYEGYLAAQEALHDARFCAADEERDYAPELRLALARTSDVERDLVLQARRSGQVSGQVADEVMQDVEARAVREML